MIRPVTPNDSHAVLSIAAASGLFDAAELEEVRGMLEAHLAGELGADHHWVTEDQDPKGPAGVAYFAPEPFTTGVWNLYMLAVAPGEQGAGHGAALVRYVESAVARAGARILLIETSGLPRYERTRSFYESLGYEREARIRDYYAAGDDKVVYWRSFAS